MSSVASITEPSQEVFAMLHNEKFGIATIIRFDGAARSLLREWKCLRAGGYALGPESAASGVMSRVSARADGLPAYPNPGESRDFKLEIEFTDDEKLINIYEHKACNP